MSVRPEDDDVGDNIHDVFTRSATDHFANGSQHSRTERRRRFSRSRVSRARNLHSALQPSALRACRRPGRTAMTLGRALRAVAAHGQVGQASLARGSVFRFTLFALFEAAFAQIPAFRLGGGPVGTRADGNVGIRLDAREAVIERTRRADAAPPPVRVALPAAVERVTLRLGHDGHRRRETARGCRSVTMTRGRANLVLRAIDILQANVAKGSIPTPPLLARPAGSAIQVARASAQLRRRRIELRRGLLQSSATTTVPLPQRRPAHVPNRIPVVSRGVNRPQRPLEALGLQVPPAPARSRPTRPPGSPRSRMGPSTRPDCRSDRRGVRTHEPERRNSRRDRRPIGPCPGTTGYTRSSNFRCPRSWPGCSAWSRSETDAHARTLPDTIA